MAIPITLVGGRGYTGEALLELIERHPEFEVARVGSRSMAGKRVSDVFPKLSTDASFESIAPGDIVSGETVVLALPNGEATRYVDAMPEGCDVLDLSADYRFDDTWYYGLPELNPRAPTSHRRVANPGCYATAVQLALAPLADDLADWPSAFGVSGYSGAGRRPSPRNDPDRLRDNLLPYALTGHMHEREISHHLGVPVCFTPHVAAYFRGISVTCTLMLDHETTVETVFERYREHFAPFELVNVQTEIPEVRDVAETPRAIVGGFEVDARDPRRVVLVSVIDNLLKGAASQAVQNLNALHEFDWSLGLDAGQASAKDAR